MSEAILSATDLTYKRGHKTLIQDISLDVYPGEIVALVGENGAGKTSLIRALAGLWEASHGSILFEGKGLRDYTPIELAQKRAYLPQETPVAFELKAIDVAELGRTPHGKTASADIAQEALEYVGMSSYRERIYQELSGGEQKRVQLARVLAQVWSEGSLLFMDEPTVHLDWKYQTLPMEIARDWAQKGYGVCLASHDFRLIEAFADRVIYLDRGFVIKSGAPREIFDFIGKRASVKK